MKITDSPFRTEVDGTPIAPDILKHNAYVAGWEHGAADHRPGAAYFDQMRILGLAQVYDEGRFDGTAARERAWKKAVRIRDSRKLEQT